MEKNSINNNAQNTSTNKEELNLIQILKLKLEESTFSASDKLVSYEECEQIFSLSYSEASPQASQELNNQEDLSSLYINEFQPQFSYEINKVVGEVEEQRISTSREIQMEKLVLFLRKLNVTPNTLDQIPAFLEFIGFNSNLKKTLFNMDKLERLLQFFSPFLPFGVSKPSPETICYNLASICGLLNSGWFHIITYEVAERRISSPAFDSGSDFICRLSNSEPRSFTIHYDGNAYSIKTETKEEQTENGTTIKCEYYYCVGLSKLYNEKFYGIKDVIQAIVENDILGIKTDRFCISDVKLSDKRIAGGVSSNIYEAEWNGTKVAAKQFKFFSKEVFFLDDFWEEAWKLKLVNHAIKTDLFTRFYGVYIKDNIKYLITEYIYGMSLEGFIKQKITGKEKLFYEILKKIAVGMNLLGHNCQLIHRDLAMRNIMIKEKGFNPVILDFGFSLYFSEIEDKKDLKYDPRVSAPEILTSPSIKCDIFSFGCLVFEVLNEKKETIKKDSEFIQDYYSLIENPFGKDMFIRCTQRDPNKRPDWNTIIQEFTEQIKKQIEIEEIKEN